MRVVVIFKENNENSRTVINFMRDFKYQTGHELEVINPESKDGIRICQLYDILQYPTVLATTNDGIMQRIWEGLPLPTISELSYYTAQK